MDSKSIHVVSDLVRMIQVAVSNYERLAETLPVGISRADLTVTSSDLALLFIRNLPHDAKQYCLLHSENEHGRLCRRQVLSMRDNRGCTWNWGHFETHVA